VEDVVSDGELKSERRFREVMPDDRRSYRIVSPHQGDDGSSPPGKKAGYYPARFNAPRRRCGRLWGDLMENGRELV